MSDFWADEQDQSELPPHLRDDAPEAVCGRCGRHTWDPEQFGQEDRMTQPDGSPCGGRFSDPRGGKDEGGIPTTQKGASDDHQ